MLQSSSLVVKSFLIFLVPVARNEPSTTIKVTTTDMITDDTSSPSMNVTTRQDATPSLASTTARDETTMVPTAGDPAASQATGPLVGGVVGGIIVTGALLLAVMIILIVVVKRLNRVKYTFDAPTGNGLPMSNMVYDSKNN